MLTVATMETKDTTRLEKAMIKLSMTNNDSLENINNSVTKFNEKITDANISVVCFPFQLSRLLTLVG
jgi:ABC-type transporter lipoprotein component MlaA